jgi:hypothetical protein
MTGPIDRSPTASQSRGCHLAGNGRRIAGRRPCEDTHRHPWARQQRSLPTACRALSHAQTGRPHPPRTAARKARMSHQPSRTGCTLGDRLDMVRSRLRAIEGTIRLIEVPEVECASLSSNDELVATALEDIAMCADELIWLHNLPVDALNLPAPTDDERESDERAVMERATGSATSKMTDQTSWSTVGGAR